MWSEFQARYPSGSLISELLQIHEGQFIVRVEVRIDGATRATGLAAAENLELAEDRARSRALLVLGIGIGLPLSAGSETATSNEIGSDSTFLAVAPAKWNRTESLPTSLGTQEGNASTSTSAIPVALEGKIVHLPSTAVDSIQAPEEVLEENIGLEYSFSPEHSENSTGALNNKVLSEIYVEQSCREFVSEPEQAEPVVVAAAREPADMSHVLAQTSIELQRLGWTTQKGRNYLKKTYGKASRQQLSELEMFEFLAYLKSQPTPKQLPLES